MALGPYGRSIACVMLLIAWTAACTGPSAEPERSPGAVEGELVSTEDVVPPEFPDDHPLPGSPTVLYSAASEYGVVVYLSSDAAREDILRSMLEDLPAAGWQVFSCRTTDAPEPVTFMVAGKGRQVSSIVIGYAAEHAERLAGARYSYFVSVAASAAEPIEQELEC